MTQEEELYHEIAKSIAGAIESKMFGAMCIKAPNGKAGVMFWKGDMVFKLPKPLEAQALKLEGAKIFEPADGRQMNGWVHVPNTHIGLWANLATSAMEFVAKIEVVEKKKKASGK